MKDHILQTITLYPDLLKLAAQGRKKSTIRAGHRAFVPGPVELAAVGIDWTVPATVTEVHHCRYGDLTADDASREGYGSLGELRNTLEEIYTHLCPFSPITVVRFEVTEE